MPNGNQTNGIYVDPATLTALANLVQAFDQARRAAGAEQMAVLGALGLLYPDLLPLLSRPDEFYRAVAGRLGSRPVPTLEARQRAAEEERLLTTALLNAMVNLITERERLGVGRARERGQFLAGLGSGAGAFLAQNPFFMLEPSLMGGGITWAQPAPIQQRYFSAAVEPLARATAKAVEGATERGWAWADVPGLGSVPVMWARLPEGPRVFAPAAARGRELNLPTPELRAAPVTWADVALGEPVAKTEAVSPQPTLSSVLAQALLSML